MWPAGHAAAAAAAAAVTVYDDGAPEPQKLAEITLPSALQRAIGMGRNKHFPFEQSLPIEPYAGMPSLLHKAHGG